jgi:hypothetical protein
MGLGLMINKKKIMVLDIKITLKKLLNAAVSS